MKRSSRFIASFLLMCVLICSLGTDAYAAFSSPKDEHGSSIRPEENYKLTLNDVRNSINVIEQFSFVSRDTFNAYGEQEIYGLKKGSDNSALFVSKGTDITDKYDLGIVQDSSGNTVTSSGKAAVAFPIFAGPAANGSVSESDWKGLISSNNPIDVICAFNPSSMSESKGTGQTALLSLVSPGIAAADYISKLMAGSYRPSFNELYNVLAPNGAQDIGSALKSAGFDYNVSDSRLIESYCHIPSLTGTDGKEKRMYANGSNYKVKEGLLSAAANAESLNFEFKAVYYCKGKYLYIYYQVSDFPKEIKTGFSWGQDHYYSVNSVVFTSDFFFDVCVDDEFGFNTESAGIFSDISILNELYNNIVLDTISEGCLDNLIKNNTLTDNDVWAIKTLNTYCPIKEATQGSTSGVYIKFVPSSKLSFGRSWSKQVKTDFGVLSDTEKWNSFVESNYPNSLCGYFWYDLNSFAFGNAVDCFSSKNQVPAQKLFYTNDEVEETKDSLIFQNFIKKLNEPFDGEDMAGNISTILNTMSSKGVKGIGTSTAGIAMYYEKFKDTIEELGRLQAVNNLEGETSTRNMKDYYSTCSDYDIVWEYLRCLYFKETGLFNYKTLIDCDGRIYKITNTKYSKTKTYDSIDDIFSKLNKYQRTILYYQYKVKMQHYNEGNNKNVSDTLKIFSADIDTSPDLSAASDLQSRGTFTIDSSVDKVNEFDSDTFLFTSAVTEVIRYAGVASNYALLTSLVSSQAEQGSVYDFYNADLEKLIGTIFSNNNEDEYSYYQRMPEKMTLIDEQDYKVFFNDGVPIGEPSDGFSRLLFLYSNVEYAAAILQDSEWAKKNKYDVSGIEEYLSATPDTDGASTGSDAKSLYSLFDTNESALLEFLGWNQNISALQQIDLATAKGLKFENTFSKDLFKTIIEVHDMCELFGIEQGDWSPYIDVLLNIYDKHEPLFEALRDNIYLFNKGAAANVTPDEPMGMFFKLGDGSSIEMTDEWMTGFAASALFVPLETNLYDANSLTLIDNSEWIANFYYKYGFYRKALMINTDNSILVNQTITNSTVGGTRFATLRDLMNYDRDIVLYVDDNFYNADKLADMLNSIDYVSVRNYNPATDTNSDNSGDAESGTQKSSDLSKKQQVQGIVRDVTDLQPDIILKTGENVYYSTTLAEKVTKLDESDQDSDDTIADAYLLSATDIIGSVDKKSVFAASEYSVQQSYGVVSSVYRSKTLYNAALHGIVTDNAIFKSSKGICNIPGTTKRDWRAIYNYAMLANLNEQMHNDSASQLDLDAPLFADIFGNIITESGLVIIPAAANPTLCKENWNPYCVGFAEYYSNGNYLNVSDFSDDSVISWLIGAEYTSKYNIQNTGYVSVNGITDSKRAADDASTSGGGFFVIDSYGNLLLKETQLQSNTLVGIINWNILNKNSKTIQQLFYNDAYFSKAKKLHEYMIVNLVCEVMRGAPIEYIDYTKEGINKSRDISKYGVYAAYKLEEVADSLIVSQDKVGVGNSMISVPNISYIPGIEGIMLYVYKAIFAITIMAFVISLYLDATKNSLGIKTLTNFLITMFMVIVGITLMPKVLNWSYYGFNKYLLHDEAAQILMLNYVKEFDGSEIGVTKITTPETNTTMYLKVGNLDVKWWDICGEILFGNATGSIKQMYSDVLKDDPLATQKNVIQRSDGLYIEMQDIFDSTNTMYSPGTGTLSNYVTDAHGTGAEVDTVASFVVPYYVILDQMVANINEYNYAQSINSYSYSIGSNGHITTYDVISPYFRSGEFLEDGYDITGLFHVYKDSNITQKILVAPSVVEGEQYKNVKQSLWYIDAMENNSDVLLDRLNELENYARQYIATNEASLGKVPDEVFLKVFAMQLAIKYNQIFGVTAGNAIEIINVDTRDLLRFMIASPDQVYRYYSYSFARFVYEQGGGIAVIFSALLITAIWISSLLKPILLIAFFALLCVNIILRRLVFQKENKAIQGYLIGCGALALFNGMYAVMIKCCMLISHYNLGTVLALLLGVVVQIGYVGTLILLLIILVKDYKNNGFTEFSTYANAFTSKLVAVRNEITSRMVARHNSAYAETADSRRYRSSNFGPNSVNEMLERDREREERGNYSPV